jgi:two-component system NtrC family sensor kinase
VAALSAGVALASYAQRRSEFQSERESNRIAETLSGAQLRAQLAESAIAIGKLAAALTHEINTPLGTLKSSVDTLLVLAARQASAPPEKQALLLKTQADLRRSIQESSERIRGVVGRLARFINLEEAEVRSANLNDLLSDVALLFDEKIRGRIRLEMDFQPLPELTCRPQLLTAVFSSLLSNAIDAIENGDGCIRMRTRIEKAFVEVSIQDNGRGMSADELENVFDPAFKVSEQRVSSGNWSLFNSRQIVYEHGGDIRIDSKKGTGTTVCVLLPMHVA